MRTVNTESLGKVFESNKYGPFVVLHITDSRNFKIRFLKTGNEQFAEGSDVRKGNVADRAVIESRRSAKKMDMSALKGSPGEMNGIIKNHLELNPNKTCTEIASSLSLKRSTVSTALRRMLGKGLKKTCVTKRTVTWAICDEIEKVQEAKPEFVFDVVKMKLIQKN